MSDVNKEQSNKKQNPFISKLISSVNKEVFVVDENGDDHTGTLLSYSQPYLNLCIRVKDKIRFIRNIRWFEVFEDAKKE